MTNDRDIFRIPERNMKRLADDLAKLSRRSVRLGGHEVHMFVMGEEMIEKNGHAIKVYDVWLDIGEIKIEGWQFVATLDHSPDAGNILRMVPNTGVELPTKFRNCGPECQHCNHKRMRRDTFILRHDNGEFKQVGSTCLVDFLGRNAAEIGKIAENATRAVNVVRAFEYDAEAEDTGERDLIDRRYLNMPQFLVHCAASVRASGWISAAVARDHDLEPTRYDALVRMNQGRGVTDEDRALAVAALDWARSLADKPTLSDWEHNVLTLSNDLYIEGRSAGIAASIVGVYHKNNNKRPKAVVLKNMEPLIALFEKGGSKLKWPKFTIEIDGIEMTLSRAGDRARFPGSINVKHPHIDDAWFGRIHLDGRFEPSRTAPSGLDAALLKLSDDPAAMASQHGHKHGHCCFCRKGLTDDRSLHVGYGETCASNWQLPYPTRSEMAKIAEAA